MKVNNISPLAEKINEHLSQRVHNNELSNEDLVSIIDTVGSFLNLETISEYANREKISYNGVLKRIETNKVQEHTLFKIRFVIDNA